jgi:hypothetical protein
MLLDSAAFKQVLGRGCLAPDHKCERDRYKNLLITAVRDAGVSPLLGGIEYAEDIANHMDLFKGGASDASLGSFVSGVRAQLKQWAT